MFISTYKLESKYWDQSTNSKVLFSEVKTVSHLVHPVEIQIATGSSCSRSDFFLDVSVGPSGVGSAVLTQAVLDVFSGSI